MLYIVISYLALSILLYFLLGGADFGAGIVELFSSRKERSRTRSTAYRAIGPVWEANHMWLIIAIVILFVGFPEIYSAMSVYLHVPLVVMLMGIIARGTAFVFRHYDAVKDDMQRIYNRIFVYSSLITPLFLGIIAGSLISGRIDPDAADFAGAYIAGWFHPFALAVGFFTVALCGFLASVYLIGEAVNEADKKRFIRKARWMAIAAFLIGGVVFVTAEAEDVPLLEGIFGNPAGLSAVILASLSLIWLWNLLGRGRAAVLRLLAGFQVSMILFAVMHAQFPYFMVWKGGGGLTLLEHYAEKAISGLGWALLLGSIFILPFLAYLFYSFQKKQDVS